MNNLSYRGSLDDKMAWLAARDFDLSKIPPHMRESVANYILFGVPVGGFLTALFSNDLKESFGRADDTNQRCMLAWVRFMHNDMPAQSQGSPERVAEWIERGGLMGHASDAAA